MKPVIDAVNLLIGLLVIATIIIYAAIVIPIVLGCISGFCLALWIISHLADAGHMLYRKVSRRFRRNG